MTRIGAAFDRLRARRRKGLVAYLTAGDPDLATTPALVVEAARRGADIVELGMPFSDPAADGPIIEAAMERALAAGTRVAGVLDAVRTIRRESDVPLVLFGYVNPILQYGPERFARDAAAAGADGLLIVDLPVEEAAEVLVPARKAGLDFVTLVAPTSTPARVRRACEAASGFVYYVSRTGVT
ncbi:MAG: tryptophan synthase subunit alpha, partial [Myxococcota bacterium]